MVTRRKFVKATGATAALLAGLGLSGCTTTTTAGTTVTTTALTTQTPVTGGSLKIGVPSMSSSVDTRVGSPTGGPPSWCSCLEPMIAFNEDFSSPEPLLATSLSTTDGLTYHIELQEGVKFHDNSEFDADDVVTLIEWIAGRVDNGYNAKYRAYFGYPDIDPTTKVDKYTVDMNLAKVQIGVDYQFGRLYPSLIIPEEMLRSTESITHPIGTGPYKITDITPGEYVKYEPFDDYWGTDYDHFWAGPAYLDTVEVYLYSDETARVAALETGEIDVAQINDAPSVTVVNAITDVSLQEVPWFTYAPAAYNSRNPPMDDIRMREALCKGVNWEGICNTVWPGQDRIWDVCAGTPYEYQGDAESLWPTYDLDEAQVLVDELDDEGKLRTLNLLKVTGRAGEAVAELVKTEIGNLGIDADLLITESAVLVKTIRDEVNSFDIQFQLFHAMCAEDFDWVNVYYSMAGITIDGRHYGGISDPVLDGYTEQWRTVISESDRVQLAQDFNERIAEMMWHMPLVKNMTRFGVRDNVHNVRGSGTFRHGPLPFTGVWKDA